ncbi:spore coat protein CotJB [Paramaledivibacter caminithermalis]|jgi:spore coat protein JB|uniref:Spore coat protein JB n=1 Tax=Paramaledivibacter caminithermalis (strain DSM 15212 / CIP 107654 / DViRD3) TaxID=1121301 RepID=A0A1M6T1E1_PARC5|nr:spore coat protein CotJB [Paramaledivibacter caminithermalis]SHK50761.1 spore coat protein JB [Paramaledivibacter caminithermalis DSM 15212]
MQEMTRKDLMRKIQEVEFKALDLNLYLDTHPKNMEALMEYNRCVYELEQLKKIYEMKYGPLLNFGFSPSQYPWRWINDPWPWEQIE